MSQLTILNTQQFTDLVETTQIREINSIQEFKNLINSQINEFIVPIKIDDWRDQIKVKIAQNTKQLMVDYKRIIEAKLAPLINQKNDELKALKDIKKQLIEDIETQRERLNNEINEVNLQKRRADNEQVIEWRLKEVEKLAIPDEDENIEDLRLELLDLTKVAFDKFILERIARYQNWQENEKIKRINEIKISIARCENLSDLDKYTEISQKSGLFEELSDEIDKTRNQIKNREIAQKQKEDNLKEQQEAFDRQKQTEKERSEYKFYLTEKVAKIKDLEELRTFYSDENISSQFKDITQEICVDRSVQIKNQPKEVSLEYLFTLIKNSTNIDKVEKFRNYKII